MRHGLDTLPPHIKAELVIHHVEIVVYKNMQAFLDANKAYKGGLADVASLTNYSNGHLRIAVFEEDMHGKRVESLGYKPAGLLQHEVGHMYNHLEGGSPVLDCIAERRKTVDKMDWEERLVYTFFMSKVGKGYYQNPEELYAKLFAIANGGGSDAHADGLLNLYFKDTIAHIKNGLTHTKHS